MFEDRTFENIRDEMLDEFPNDIDVREGSVAYDSVTAVAAKVAMLYVDLENCYELTNLEKSTGEYLDRFASEHGISRIMATNAVYEFLYSGILPVAGEEFYDETGNNYFRIIINDNGQYTLVSEDSGTDYNNITYGTDAVPVSNIDGLISSNFGDLIIAAIDEETDDALRSRIKDKISGPAENGNMAQYKSWCESIEGVGRAFVIPLKYGPNTVEAVLISPEGLPVIDTVVTAVQEYIDPIEPVYTITDNNGNRINLGAGYGEGVANIGAHFRAVSAKTASVNISLSIELKSGYTLEQAKQDITSTVSEYLKTLALDAEDSKTVRFARVGSLIEQLQSVFDYQDLKINKSSDNIQIEDTAVAVLSEVSVNVSV